MDEAKAALLADPLALFNANREAMRGTFPGQGLLTHGVCAFLCAPKGILLDAARIKDMRQVVRSRTGITSQFRGYPMLPLCTLLSSSLMPDSDFERVQKQHEALRQAGFRNSPYLAEAAFWPLLYGEELGQDACAAACDMQRAARKAHPFLDESSGCGYALGLAAAGVDASVAHAETERGYELLKKEFPSAGTSYALARVLMLGNGETEHKCERVIALYRSLRALDLKYGRYHELPPLGLLSLLPLETAALAEGIKQIDELQKREKDFKSWATPQAYRLLFSLGLYAMGQPGVEERYQALLMQGLMQSVAGLMIAASAAAAASS